MKDHLNSADYRKIENALTELARHYTDRPSLDEMAQLAGMSKFHFQRLFTRWAGISPARFVNCLALDHAKDLLAEGGNVLDASLDAGLSGPGRLHDLFISHEAVTPGEFKMRGSGMRLDYGFHPTPLGECTVVQTPRGVCGLGFGTGSREDTLATLTRGWERAELVENPRRTAAVANHLFAPDAEGSREGPRLLLRGTNFQVNVWRALLRIPPGQVVSYGQLAASLGQPGAARAVGRAVAANPVALLIPCHRVIQGLGLPGEYRWGAPRKRILLALEAAQHHPEAWPESA